MTKNYYEIRVTFDTGYDFALDFVDKNSNFNKILEDWNNYYKNLSSEGWFEVYYSDATKKTIKEIPFWEYEALEMFGTSFSQLNPKQKISVTEYVLETYHFE